MKIYYLAHPVAGDNFATVDKNLEDVLLIQAALWRVGFAVINPWYTCVKAVEKTNERERALQMDEEVVRRCSGIILTGHKVSEGMQRELLAAHLAGLEVIDLVGMTPQDIELYYERNKPDHSNGCSGEATLP